MILAPLRRGFPFGNIVSLFDPNGRFSVPTSDQTGVARSRGQAWPVATAGGGA